MKNCLVCTGFAFLFAVVSSVAHAEPGEWWEVTAKMEMEGMPFAMPAQTSKVCIPKGQEKDPRYTQGKDSNCKMTDVKQSGNKVTFKGTCVNQGETMNMVGESMNDGKSFTSNVRMTGKSQGEPINMAMTSSGKHIGGSCDTEEMGRKAKAQVAAGMAAACDTSQYTTSSWVANSSLFIGNNPTCPGKKETLCKIMRSDVPKDLQAYELLKVQENSKNSVSVVKACNLNLEAMRKNMCKDHAKRGPLSFLDANCPSEAKSFRELQRKREECAGRGYTGVTYTDDMKKCMGGQTVEMTEAKSVKSGKAKADAANSDSDSSEVTDEAIKQGTKALKGLFGF